MCLMYYVLIPLGLQAEQAITLKEIKYSSISYMSAFLQEMEVAHFFVISVYMKHFLIDDTCSNVKFYL